MRPGTADASGEPLIIKGLPARPHEVLIELVNANHQTIDKGVVTFVIPEPGKGRAQQPQMGRRRPFHTDSAGSGKRYLQQGAPNSFSAYPL